MSFLKSVGKSIGSVIPNPILGQASLFKDEVSGKKQQENANKMAMEAWNLANDYNHPINQMQRLQDAGLNPLLVYGSGSVTGNTTSQPALVGGGISTTTESAFRGLSNIMSIMQGKANIDNTHAQTQASNASAVLSGAQASNVNAQTAINQVKAGYEEKNAIADLNYKRALTEKTRQETRTASANADMIEAENQLLGSVGGAKGAQAAGGFLKSTGRFVRSIMR